MSASKEANQSSDLLKATLNAFAGGISGVASRTLTSPMERLKVLQQVQSSSNSPYSGVISGLKHMYKTEGASGYFKGNLTNCARIAPFSALQFVFFDVYKQGLLMAGCGGEDKKLNPYWTLAAGAFAGSTASFMCYPLDLVRSYLSVQTNQGKFNGIWHTLTSIHAAEGVRGLFRGCVATLLGITPYIALNFFAFDTLKRNYLPPISDPMFPVINLLLGGLSGGFAATLTYPSDVIRRRIQLQGLGKEMVKDMPQYNGIVDCIRVIVKTEGIKGLYRGLNACLLKVIPSMAIAFTIHETLRNKLDFDFNKKA